MHYVIGAAAGVVFGLVCPGIIRKIRAAISGEAKKIETTVATDATKAASKL